MLHNSCCTIHVAQLNEKGMASTGEANLLRVTRGLIRPLPGGNGPVNNKRMEEIRGLLVMAQSAMTVTPSNEGNNSGNINGSIVVEESRERMQAMMELLQSLIIILGDEKKREEAAPIFAEIQSVFRMVAVEVLEVRGSRAMRSILGNVSV